MRRDAASRSCTPRVPRSIAVDWSGARAGERRSLWLAEVVDGVVVRLECGRTRAEVAELLLTEAARDPRLVVGLDFAFSFPEWFLAARGIDDVSDAWALVAREGEAWLSDPQPPFWRARKPQLASPWFRRTELDVRATGAQPKSVFQLGGHGQVGTSSLRGMPFLRRLRERFAVWPFDEPRLPLVVEIYPRLFVRRFEGRVDPSSNEHARDALASALAIATWDGDWTRLPRDSRYELEGRIWHQELVQPGG